MKKKRKKIIPPIYVLSHKLKYKPFKELQKRLVKDDGPTPIGIDKILWKLLRERKIYCWFSEDMPNDMGIGLKLPKNRKIKVITNPINQNR